MGIRAACGVSGLGGGCEWCGVGAAGAECAAGGGVGGGASR